MNFEVHEFVNFLVFHNAIKPTILNFEVHCCMNFPVFRNQISPGH